MCAHSTTLCMCVCVFVCVCVTVDYIQIAEWLIDPLCRGIYASSSHSLSVKSCFPKFYNYEQSHGSLIKGALFSKQGMCLLPHSCTSCIY